MLRIVDVESHRRDHFTLPEWRWCRAIEYLDSPRDERVKINDPLTVATIRFLAAQTANSLLNPGTNPIGRAFAIYRTNDPLRWKLKALVLAGESDDAIAERLKFDVEVVTNFVTLFFDVRPRLSFSTTVMSFLNTPPCYFYLRENDLESIWMWMGYGRGVEALEITIAATTGEGKERFSAEVLDAAALLIETVRLPIDKYAEVQRLSDRKRAEDAGLPGSTYFRARPRNKKPEFDASKMDEAILDAMRRFGHLR